MYCYDFICTYKLIDESIRDILYQQQILEAFSIKKYDEEAIKKEKKEIYETLKENLDFLIILEKITDKYPQLCNSDLDALSILFSYDYFDMFHRYLIDIFTNKNTNDNTNPKFYKNIINALE